MKKLLLIASIAILATAVFAQEGEVEIPDDGREATERYTEEQHPADGEQVPEEPYDDTITNPNYEAEVARLKTLCKTIKDEMHELFLLKDHHKQEGAILGHAAELGAHLDERHVQWEKEHHEWTCEQARQVMEHESTKQFIDHFEKWYDGKDMTPAVSHKESVRLVTHLRDELEALRLMNEETKVELDGIIEDLNQLEKWHLHLRKSYDAVMHQNAKDSCEKPFQEFIKVLHEIHGEAVPEWFHIAEGTNLLLEQCKEDPNLNADL